MSLGSKFDAGMRLLSLAGDALTTIAKLTRGVTTADRALAVVKAIRAFLETFEQANKGKVTIKAVERALAKLKADLAANDAAADAALKQRFPAGKE